MTSIKELRVKPTGGLTLGEHAEAWMKEQGHEVPERASHEWILLYNDWHRFAFAGIGDTLNDRERRQKEIESK